MTILRLGTLDTYASSLTHLEKALFPEDIDSLQVLALKSYCDSTFAPSEMIDDKILPECLEILSAAGITASKKLLITYQHSVRGHAILRCCHITGASVVLKVSLDCTIKKILTYMRENGLGWPYKIVCDGRYEGCSIEKTLAELGFQSGSNRKMHLLVYLGRFAHPEGCPDVLYPVM